MSSRMPPPGSNRADNGNGHGNGNSDDAKKKYSVKFKRSRSTRACEVCHSRKVRCDAMIHIPCTNCLTFGCECKFPEPKVRKNAKKLKKVDGTDQATVKNEVIAEVPKQTNSTINTPSSGTTTSSVDMNKSSSNNSSTSTNSKKKNQPVAAVSAQSAKIDQSKFSQKIAALSFIGTSSTATLLGGDSGDISNSEFINDEFVPPSLKHMIEKTRVGLDTVQMEILRVRGAFLLPEKQLCDDLIKTFFEKIYPTEPIINRTKFWKEYEDGSVSILLLQAVLLAASRVSDNENLFDSDGSNYLASCTFFQRAKALYDANYEKDPLTLVQSLTLFTKFWEGLDDILGNSYYWSRIAVTVAQGYGFHRDITDAPLSEDEAKMWRLVWWNLYIKDISTSVGFGRPRIIHLEDCDVKMLTLEDFPNDVSYQDAEALIQMIKLSEIISIVLQEQYSPKAEKFRHRENWVITHCDMLMSSWRNNLPHDLQYSPTKKFPLSVNCLNLYYYSAVCLVHRSNMIRTTTLHGKAYPSEGIVFQASRIIADIAAKMLKYNQMRYCNALIISTLFTASMTFICHLESTNTSISKTARLGFEVLYKSLEELGKNYLITIVIAHNVKKLANDDKSRQRLMNHLAKKNMNHGRPSSVGHTNPNGFPVQPLQEHISPQDNTPNDYQENYQKYPHQRVSINQLHQEPQPQPVQEPEHEPQQPTHDEFDVSHQQQDLEFPDLYLFTNTLPSSSWNDFNPSELFPTAPPSANDIGSGSNNHQHSKPRSNNSNSPNHNNLNSHNNSYNNSNHGSGPGSSSSQNKSPSDGGINEFSVNGFDPNAFSVSLPELDFQNFNNSISLQNLASINDFFGPGTGGWE